MTGEQVAEPTVVNCWDNYQFNTATCEWENLGELRACESCSVDDDGNPIIVTEIGELCESQGGVLVYEDDDEIWVIDHEFTQVGVALNTPNTNTMLSIVDGFYECVWTNSLGSDSKPIYNWPCANYLVDNYEKVSDDGVIHSNWALPTREQAEEII